MRTKEQEILNNMKKLHINRKEAEELYLIDHEDIVIPEVAEMERKAKQIKRYEKSDKKRKPTSRERKVDLEKKELLQILTDAIGQKHNIVNIKNEAEFSFTLNNNSYTVKLIKHRPPKN